MLSTPSTTLVKTIDWPNDEKIFTLRSKNCLIDDERLQEHIYKFFSKENCIVRPVSLRIFNIGWMFYGGRRFMSHADLFRNQPESFYKTALMLNLLEAFWKKDQIMIIFRMFLPYLIYLSLSISFYYYGLLGRSDEAKEETLVEMPIFITGVCMLVFWFYIMINEVL